MSESQKGWKEAKTGLQIYNEIEDGYNGGKDVAEQDWNECFEWVPVSVADARLAEKDKEIQKLKEKLEDKKFWSRSKGEALAKCDHAYRDLEKELDGLKQKLRELHRDFPTIEHYYEVAGDLETDSEVLDEEYLKKHLEEWKKKLKDVLGVKEGKKDDV
jgi:predicted metal-dependent hydrolase